MKRPRKLKKLTRDNLAPEDKSSTVLTNDKVIKEAKVIPKKNDDPSYYGGIQYEHERR
jgi:hypothetical protein